MLGMSTNRPAAPSRRVGCGVWPAAVIAGLCALVPSEAAAGGLRGHLGAGGAGCGNDCDDSFRRFEEQGKGEQLQASSDHLQNQQVMQILEDPEKGDRKFHLLHLLGPRWTHLAQDGFIWGRMQKTAESITVFAAKAVAEHRGLVDFITHLGENEIPVVHFAEDPEQGSWPLAPLQEKFVSLDHEGTRVILVITAHGQLDPPRFRVSPGRGLSAKGVCTFLPKDPKMDLLIVHNSCFSTDHFEAWKKVCGDRFYNPVTNPKGIRVLTSACQGLPSVRSCSLESSPWKPLFQGTQTKANGEVTLYGGYECDPGDTFQDYAVRSGSGCNRWNLVHGETVCLAVHPQDGFGSASQDGSHTLGFWGLCPPVPEERRRCKNCRCSVQ